MKSESGIIVTNLYGLKFTSPISSHHETSMPINRMDVS